MKSSMSSILSIVCASGFLSNSTGLILSSCTSKGVRKSKNLWVVTLGVGDQGMEIVQVILDIVGLDFGRVITIFVQNVYVFALVKPHVDQIEPFALSSLLELGGTVSLVYNLIDAHFR